MTDYELSRFCAANPECGCNCMKCAAFAQHMNEELYGDEPDNEEDYE